MAVAPSFCRRSARRREVATGANSLSIVIQNSCIYQPGRVSWSTGCARNCAPIQRGELFDALQACLGMEDESTPYRDLARQFEASETAIRLQVFRLRRRFGKMLREEVSQTVETPAELEQEHAWLAKTLRQM